VETISESILVNDRSLIIASLDAGLLNYQLTEGEQPNPTQVLSGCFIRVHMPECRRFIVAAGNDMIYILDPVTLT